MKRLFVALLLIPSLVFADTQVVVSVHLEDDVQQILPTWPPPEGTEHFVRFPYYVELQGQNFGSDPPANDVDEPQVASTNKFTHAITFFQNTIEYNADILEPAGFEPVAPFDAANGWFWFYNDEWPGVGPPQVYCTGLGWDVNASVLIQGQSFTGRPAPTRAGRNLVGYFKFRVVRVGGVGERGNRDIATIISMKCVERGKAGTPHEGRTFNQIGFCTAHDDRCDNPGDAPCPPCATGTSEIWFWGPSGGTSIREGCVYIDIPDPDYRTGFDTTILKDCPGCSQWRDSSFTSCYEEDIIRCWNWRMMCIPFELARPTECETRPCCYLCDNFDESGPPLEAGDQQNWPQTNRPYRSIWR